MLGAYIRYFLGLRNKYWPNFPLYTFFANMLGTLLIFISDLLARQYFRPVPPIEPTSILAALPDAFETGLCGTISTVSSFVKEIYFIRILVYRYWYAAGSLLGGQIITLIAVLIVYLR